MVSPLFATNITKGPNSASDESSQTVQFTVTPVGSENGIFRVSPSISSTGTLAFTPTADAVGSVVYVVSMLDSGAGNPTRGDINAATPVTITINVRPVNDAPTLNGSVIGTSKVNTPDDSWAVNNIGVINYTLAESATSSGQGFVMDLRNTANRIGLLDPYLVGPANEADSTLGGSQTLRIKSVPATTALGGTLTVLSRDANNFPTQIRYNPPANYNLLQSPRDFFNYEVEDDAAGAGETWNLSTGALIENRLTVTGRVELTLNSINDAPQFTVPVNTVSLLEDAGAITINGFATGIAAGPASATDELTGPNAQTVSFTLTSQGSTTGLFTVSPTLASDGTLKFTAAPDAFGTAVYVVTLVDSGPSNPARGDINTSLPVTITINVRPVNDDPALNPSALNTGVVTDANHAWAVNGSGQITYTLPEDNTQSVGTVAPYVIDTRRTASTAGRIGLLDVFSVGPTNESANVVGGNQVIQIVDIPTTTDWVEFYKWSLATVTGSSLGLATNRLPTTTQRCRVTTRSPTPLKTTR